MLSWFLETSDWLRHRGRARHWTAEQASGRRAEDLAHRYLQRAGMKIVARNYRARSGTAELDLVAWDGDTLVFVEVKSRANEAYGAPDRAVGAEKRRHVFRAAIEYARRTGASLESARFDIVNVVFSEPPRITHIADAFGIPTAV